MHRTHRSLSIARPRDPLLGPSQTGTWHGGSRRKAHARLKSPRIRSWSGAGLCSQRGSLDAVAWPTRHDAPSFLGAAGALARVAPALDPPGGAIRSMARLHRYG